MALHRISASALIPSPAAQVYGIIADYRNSHFYILPKPPFVSLDVEEGGVGAGTVINFQMNVMGKVQKFHALITEPVPGSVLVETVSDTGTVTTFTVEPRGDGQQAYVTIATELKVRDGIAEKIEGFFTTRVLQPTYDKELQQLAAVAAKQVA
jgi:Polyketide cyclase / dehydrase and lipid transport